MVQSSPNIQIISPSSQFTLALINLQEFAVSRGLTAKREIEKKAALHLVREVMKDNNLVISYAETGRPFLSNGTKISVSHAGDKLVVLLSGAGAEVGVDIEQVRDKVLRVKEKFLSPAELKDLENAPLEMYTLYWAVKEAVYKAANIPGLLFAEQIAIEPFAFDTRDGKIMCVVKRNGAEKEFVLRFSLTGEYVLVYTHVE